MKKFTLILLISAAPCMARVLTLIPSNFDEFVSKMVPEKEQKLFQGYYAQLENNIAKEKEESQRSTHYYIHSKALASLEEKHAVWGSEVNHFLTDLRFLDASYDSERSEVRSFLNWYGAYQEYEHAREEQIKKTAQAHLDELNKDGFVSNAKSYVTKATQKIGGWFNGFRKRKTT